MDCPGEVRTGSKLKQALVNFRTTGHNATKTAVPHSDFRRGPLEGENCLETFSVGCRKERRTARYGPVGMNPNAIDSPRKDE